MTAVIWVPQAKKLVVFVKQAPSNPDPAAANLAIESDASNEITTEGGSSLAIE